MPSPRFKKGEPRPPGAGRKKGSPNRTTTEIRESARKLLEDPKYQESLAYRLMKGTAPHMETMLHQYAYGKPKDTVEIEIGLRPLQIIVEHVRQSMNGNGHDDER